MRQTDPNTFRFLAGNEPPDVLFSQHPIGSITFFYVPHSDKLYGEPGIPHYEMLERNKELFNDLYQGVDIPRGKRSEFLSRGKALQHHAILGRIRPFGEDIVITLWNQPEGPEFRRFIAKLLQNPEFAKAQDRIVVVAPGREPVLLPSLIGGEKPPSLRKLQLRADSDRSKVYEINGRPFTLSQLQQLRSALHTGAQGQQDPREILCHPDMRQHPELSGYIPVNCSGHLAPKRPTSPENPYMNKYGEGFCSWLSVQQLFLS